jgi:hypothetical protein
MVIMVIADTGNHRIRLIEYHSPTKYCVVKCLSGLCGNNSATETLFKTRATPNSGYADGLGLEARFSAPQGVAFMDNGNIAVADTGNFLIRWITPSGNTTTLSGGIIPGQSIILSVTPLKCIHNCPVIVTQMIFILMLLL